MKRLAAKFGYHASTLVVKVSSPRRGQSALELAAEVLVEAYYWKAKADRGQITFNLVGPNSMGVAAVLDANCHNITTNIIRGAGGSMQALNIPGLEWGYDRTMGYAISWKRTSLGK